MNYYYESLKGYNHEYLLSAPTKRDALSNATIKGNVSILANSNNRAVVIDTPDKVFLQSYDTLIIELEKATGAMIKLWGGYSATTMKHINEFLNLNNRRSMNKKEWTALTVNATI